LGEFRRRAPAPAASIGNVQFAPRAVGEVYSMIRGVGLAQQGLHFGEDLSDWIEVWRMGGQEKETRLS